MRKSAGIGAGVLAIGLMMSGVSAAIEVQGHRGARGYKPEDTLLVPEESYIARVVPALPDELFDVDWLVVLSGSSLHSGKLKLRVLSQEFLISAADSACQPPKDSPHWSS